MMNENAERVGSAVSRYLSIDEPGYAVLIDGCWGSGKSHFIKQCMKSDITDKKWVYISLFGLKSNEDIDNAVGAALISLPGGDLFKEAGKFLAQWSDLGNASGLIGSIAASTGKWARGSILKAISKDHVLVFDDLERFEGDSNIRAALAVGSKYAEQQGASVIFVGDQSRIIDHSYALNKEKCIRYVYRFSHDACQSLEIALSHISDSAYKCLLTGDIHQHLRASIESSPCRNIRTIISALTMARVAFESHQTEFSAFPDRVVRLVEETILYAHLQSIANFPFDIFERFLASPHSYWVKRHLEKAEEDRQQSHKVVDDAVRLIPEQLPLHPSMWKFLRCGVLEDSGIDEEIASWRPLEENDPLDYVLGLYSNNDSNAMNKAIGLVLDDIAAHTLQFRKMEKLVKLCLLLDRLASTNSIKWDGNKFLTEMKGFLAAIANNVSHWFDSQPYKETARFNDFDRFRDSSPQKEQFWPDLEMVWSRVREWRLNMEILAVGPILKEAGPGKWERIDGEYGHLPILHMVSIDTLVAACDQDGHESVRAAHIFFHRRRDTHFQDQELEQEAVTALFKELSKRWANSAFTILNEPRAWLLESLSRYRDYLDARKCNAQQQSMETQ